MTIMNKDSVGQSFMNIKTMNGIAGSLGGSEESVDLQLSLCFEELEEAIDAFEKGNAVNLLKESVDLFVVTCGLLQKLESAGYDVEKAMRKVDENNLSKFPTTRPQQFPAAAATCTYNEMYGRYVIKRPDGKFLKPVEYLAVDLSDCANVTFFATRD
jgi:NTP pyrophosphatase (non-canonical NTP hydrolase)